MKYCSNCGNQMQDMDNACSWCGARVDRNIRAYREGEQVSKPSNDKAILGLILGIGANIFFWFPVVPVVIAIIGLVLSIIGIKSADSGKSGRGIAIAGLVCSTLALVISGLLTSWYLCCTVCGTSGNVWL